MIVEIPVRPGVLRQTFSFTIGTVLYRFEVYWQERSESWYMDMYDQGNVALISGAKLSNNWNPHKGIVVDNQPSGRFVVYAKQTPGTPATSTDFGLDKRVGLYHDSLAT